MWLHIGARTAEVLGLACPIMGPGTDHHEVFPHLTRFQSGSIPNKTFANYRRYLSRLKPNQVNWNPWSSCNGRNSRDANIAIHISHMRIFFYGPMSYFGYLGERVQV